MSSNSSLSDSEDGTSAPEYGPIHKLAMIRLEPPRNPDRPFTSFGIKDILGQHRNFHRKSSDKASLLSHYPVSLLGTICHRSAPVIRSSIPRIFNGHRTYRHHHRVHRSCPKTQNPSRNVPSQNHHSSLQNGTKIVRPWDSGQRQETASNSSSDVDVDDDINDDEINVDEDPLPLDKSVSPLDALMEMATKTFDGLDGSDSADEKRRDGSVMFGKNQTPKKRRKSRTAFTNQQIYELEKRFLYQKYLTPADRDEIAMNLGLTNAQVITWFQNRRAKLKRDLEEMKNDVDAARRLNLQAGDKCSEEHARDLREAEAMLASKYNIKDSCRSSIEPFTRAVQNDAENYKLQKNPTKGSERNN